MNRSLIFAVLLLLAGMPLLYSQQTTRSFNKVLADSLSRMVVDDQVAANVRTGKYKDYTTEAWNHFKDSVFDSHQKVLEKIFRQYGFPGYDLVGKEGAQHFWLMVQHCDRQPAFQEQVLAAMKDEVKRSNANAQNYAYLTDRVLLNTQRKQLYGTQVTYNLDSCQAIPKPLQDSSTVNLRRKEMGLGSVEEYLNMMGKMHFEMNKEVYTKKGITKAKLYEEPRQ